ncbi:MAG: hypothetical protein F6K31_26400 [Symploca sp. SIO2G7]|nr:hypothetical protein [Symploca sp. SIO2G7]
MRLQLSHGIRVIARVAEAIAKKLALDGLIGKERSQVQYSGLQMFPSLFRVRGL